MARSRFLFNKRKSCTDPKRVSDVKESSFDSVFFCCEPLDFLMLALDNVHAKVGQLRRSDIRNHIYHDGT